MSTSRASLLLFRLAFLVTLVVGTHLATAPLEGTAVASINDKVSHLLGFAILAFLLDFSFPEPRYTFWRYKALPLAAYGFGIELVQDMLPHRTFSMLDFAADLLGIGLYFLLLPLVRHLPILRRRWNNTA